MVYFVKFVRLAIDDSWSPHEIQFRHGPPADISPSATVRGACALRSGRQRHAVRTRAVEPAAAHSRPSAAAFSGRARARGLAELPAPKDDLIGQLRRSWSARCRTMAPAQRSGACARHEHAHAAAPPPGVRHPLCPAGRRRAPSAVRRYLADANLSLGEIAYLLGYSESSAFNRAYRRWTGRPRRPTAAAPPLDSGAALATPAWADRPHIAICDPPQHICSAITSLTRTDERT